MPMPPSEADSTTETSSDTPRVPDREFYWDWFKHEEDISTNRGNFFLVGQSMLFAAYAALRAASSPPPFSTISSICCLGIYGASIWLLLSYLHLFRTRIHLIHALRRSETRVYTTKRFQSERGHRMHGSFNLMHTFLPVGILATWVVLLINVLSS
jgi:hypothetical protein